MHIINVVILWYFDVFFSAYLRNHPVLLKLNSGCVLPKLFLQNYFMRICRGREAYYYYYFRRGWRGRDWYGILVCHRTAVALTSYTYVGYWFSS